MFDLNKNDERKMQPFTNLLRWTCSSCGVRTCSQISLHQCCVLVCPPSSPSDLTLICLSVLSSSPCLLVSFTLDSRLSSNCVCSERPLCRAAAHVILCGLWCQSQEAWGARRGQGPAIDRVQGPGAGRAPGVGRQPRAAPSPVTVSSLSLTVCSQLDSFCPRVKAFSQQTLHCHLGRAFCTGEEMASVA